MQSSNIICNGIPKSGTHALVKAVQLLGQPTRHEHLPYSQKLNGKQILIKRHPRNIIISWVRFIKQQVTEGFIIHEMKTFEDNGLVQCLNDYSGYLTDKDTLVVSFESLISEESELRNISDFIGCEYIGDAFNNIIGLTPTYTGELSNWEDHWTDNIDKEWVKLNGHTAERLWNY